MYKLLKRQTRACLGLAGATLLTLSFTVPAHAQSKQFWPEVSTFVKLNDSMRFYFLATTVKENKETTEGEYGPNLDFYIKPWRKQRKKWLGVPLDESKARRLSVRVGYRYILPYGSDDPGEHRGVLEVTPRSPLPAGILVSDRSRMDFRFIGGVYSWRYRNRLTFEREFSIRRFKFAPYIRGEAYFDSRYDKWSRTAIIAGSTFPVTKHVELEPYWEHQNDSGGSSNRDVNALGAVVNLYF